MDTEEQYNQTLLDLKRAYELPECEINNTRIIKKAKELGALHGLLCMEQGRTNEDQCMEELFQANMWACGDESDITWTEWIDALYQEVAYV